jgi:geranylgeranyl diphosphate synthase, type I
LSVVADSVDARIRTLLNSEIARWSAIDPDLALPIEALANLVLSGGKRLRPAFCHLAYVGAGGDPDHALLVDVGAGLELLHTFALVHDDIMDDSATRRGMNAIHVQFGDHHTSMGWNNESRRFGEGVAILVGDLAFVYADMLLRNVNSTATTIFNELRIEVNIGQYLDLLGTARGKPTLSLASRICQYKSGKYTIERPLHLGAALADRLPDFESSLTAYGLPLGEAFQLQDDLLGTLGDADLLGKPVGIDLREGKPTALIAHAFERATGAQHAVLDGIGRPGLTANDITLIQRVLIDTGAVAQVEDDITRLRDSAIAAIKNSTLTCQVVDQLVELAHFVTDRKT